jgi:pimeloyl-ACP methyl ester carboxylesterase
MARFVRCWRLLERIVCGGFVLYEPPLAIKTDWIGELERLVISGDHDAALSGFLGGADIPEEQLETIRSSRAWPALLQAVPALPRELRAGAAWKPPEGPIDVPTLFLRGGGTADPTYLEGFDQFRAMFTAARLELELIPGQRHIAQVFAPEEFGHMVSDFSAEPPV